MADSVTIALGIDATGARRGADEFASAADRVAAAGKRASDSAESLRRSMAEGQRVYNETRTRAEQYSSELQRLSNLHRVGAINTETYSRALQQAKAQFADVSSSAGGISKAFLVANSAIGSFVGNLAAQATAQFTSFLASLPGQLLTVADSYSRLDSRIALVTAGMVDLTTAHADLLAIANRAGTSFEATGGFFARVAGNAKNLGLSYQDLITLTEALQNGFRISGASATETSAAMLQLGQSFAKGALNGDEFTSMGENASRVLDALADALGVNRGQISEWAKDGQLSAEVLSAALMSQSENMRREVELLGRTTQDASRTMQNAWNELLVQFDKTTGASATARDAMDSLAAWMASPAGAGAVETFANTIRDLIATLQSLVEMGAPVANFLNQVLSSVQAAGKAINEFARGQQAALPGKLAAAMPDQAANQALEKMLGSIDKMGQAAKPRQPQPDDLTQLGLAQFGLGRMTELRVNPYQQTPEELRARLPVGKTKAGGTGRSRASGGATSNRAAEALADMQREVDFFGREREKAIEDAVDRLGDKATTAQKEAARGIAAQLFDMRQLKTQKDALDDLSQSVELFSDKRAQAQAQAAERLGDFASPEQIERAKEMAGALYDLQQRESVESMLQGIDRAYEQSIGNQVRLVEMRRDEEIKALNESTATAEEKARARVQIEETASREILEIRRRESEETQRYQEEYLSTQAQYAFGQERRNLQKQLVEMRRDAELERIRLSAAPQEQKDIRASYVVGTAQRQLEIIDPTPWQAAARTLQEFGEGLTGVEGMTQGVIQGLASIGATATSAFADAIVSGESFSDVLESLAQSMQKMIIQMTMQMALQQALGAGASALGGWMAGPGAGANAQAGGPVTYNQEFGIYRMAKGGAINAELPPGIYTSPRYFETDTTGVTRAARGVGLLGEAGPEAVLPLRRTDDGRLGVQAYDDRLGAHTVLPVARLRNGNLGIVSEEPDTVQRYETGGGVDADLSPGVYHAPKRFQIDGGSFYPMMSGGNLAIPAEPKAILPMRYGKMGRLGVEIASSQSGKPWTAQVTRSPSGALAVRAPTEHHDEPITRFASGGVVGLPEGVYTRPTYFRTELPGLHTLARGGVVSSSPPVIRETSQSSGVNSGGGQTVNVIVNNNSSAKVSQESKDRPDGNKDIILTIADQVENIVATRMQRSGTRVNRAVGTVGQTVAR